MPPRTPRRPTDAELEILNILWQRGASTLREIYNIVKDRRSIGLTTTLKTLQIMTDKGLVNRDGSNRPSRYTAASVMKTTRARMLKDLVEKVFCGSPKTLLIQAIEEGGLSDAELKEMRAVIDSVRKRKPGKKR